MTPTQAEDLPSRKDRHLNAFTRKLHDHGSTRLDHVLLHQSALGWLFPEEVSWETHWLGISLKTPFFIPSITGGTRQGLAFNRSAARAAARLGIPLATGSLRIAFENPETLETFDVNAQDTIPLFFGNLGVSSALLLGPSRVRELCGRLHMHGLFLYFNHAQEMAQAPSEHQPVNLDAVGDFIGELGLPVLVKETGMGFSRPDLERITSWPISGLDTAGAGGSNFWHIDRETDASHDRHASDLAQLGIPTAMVIQNACDLMRPSGHPVIAGGGIRSGLDMARALVLGARMASCAAPLVLAWRLDSENGIFNYINDILHDFRSVMALCGCRNPEDLHKVSYFLEQPLR